MSDKAMVLAILGSEASADRAVVVLKGSALVPGDAIGVLGGSLLGTLRHKGLGLGENDRDRIVTELRGGKATVGVLAPAGVARVVSARLADLGGVPETHAGSKKAVQHAASPVGASVQLTGLVGPGGRQRTRVVEGPMAGGYTGAFELICGQFGDHPYLDYSEIPRDCSRSAGRPRWREALPRTRTTSGLELVADGPRTPAQGPPA